MAQLCEILTPPGAPPRYSSRPFPPYRYVPGLHPHPVAHPHGHSYSPSGDHPKAGPLLPPERWRESEDYLYGVDLYNHGYFWEAHEAWEGLWQQTDKKGPQGQLLQGLIQVSAAHLKRHLDQPDGVVRLLARACEHLEAAQAGLEPEKQFMGVDIARHTAAVHGYFEGTSASFPFLNLAILYFPRVTLSNL